MQQISLCLLLSLFSFLFCLGVGLTAFTPTSCQCSKTHLQAPSFPCCSGSFPFPTKRLHWPAWTYAGKTATTPSSTPARKLQLACGENAGVVNEHVCGEWWSTWGTCHQLSKTDQPLWRRMYTHLVARKSPHNTDCLNGQWWGLHNFWVTRTTQTASTDVNAFCSSGPPNGRIMAMSVPQIRITSVDHGQPLKSVDVAGAITELSAGATRMSDRTRARGAPDVPTHHDLSNTLHLTAVVSTTPEMGALHFVRWLLPPSRPTTLVDWEKASLLLNVFHAEQSNRSYTKSAGKMSRTTGFPQSSDITNATLREPLAFRCSPNSRPCQTNRGTGECWNNGIVNRFLVLSRQTRPLHIKQKSAPTTPSLKNADFGYTRCNSPTTHSIMGNVLMPACPCQMKLLKLCGRRKNMRQIGGCWYLWRACLRRINLGRKLVTFSKTHQPTWLCAIIRKPSHGLHRLLLEEEWPSGKEKTGNWQP